MYRDDLTALTARHDALATEVAHKARELEQATALLEEAQARARLPVLDNIRIAAPCTADWAAMSGDDRVRYCGDCKKNVFNLSELTRTEAEALIIEKQGQLCARYFRRADGTILTKDCSVGVARRRKRRLIAAGAAALLAGGGAMVWRSLRTDEASPVAIDTSARDEVATPQVIELETLVAPEPPVEVTPELTALERHRLERQQTLGALIDDSRSAKARLRELERQQAELRLRLHEAKIARDQAARKRHVIISEECLNNPLSKGCD